MKKICIVLGAEPNFIKVTSVVKTIRSNAQEAGNEISYQLVYTGKRMTRHWNLLFSMTQAFRNRMLISAQTVGMNELTGQVMGQFERYLQQNATDVVIVVDDLASTMAVAIVTKKQGVQLAHIAAGTRSFDVTMPKEINRLVIDGLSDILFTTWHFKQQHRQQGRCRIV